jgi:SET domain-containing protein
MFLVKTKLIETSHKGIGVEATQLIPKGTIIWKYCDRFNKVFKAEELQHLTPIEKDFIDTYMYSNEQGDYVLDLDNSRFMNHSDNPNTSFPYDDVYGYATKDIKIGDELTCDYKEFDKGSKIDLGFTNKEHLNA